MNSVKSKGSKVFIAPCKNTIKTNGKIYYKEDNQAWCLLRLRKEIIDEFNQLKERYSKFSYDAIYYRTYEELEKALKELKKTGQPLPILMWLVKDIGNAINLGNAESEKK